ncbi:MAG: RraA family protein [Methanobacteriaceae archaeon]
MARNMKISPRAILEKFSSDEEISESLRADISTSHLADALKNLTGTSHVVPGVKPIKNGFNIWGEVVTAETSSNDWGTVLKAIDQANAGKILFLKSTDDQKAIWGELTSKAAINRKIKGTIVFGAARDVSAVISMDYPVFSRAVVPNAGVSLNEGKVNVPLQIEGLTVTPGDFVMADDGGVVVVPQDKLLETLKESLKIKDKEEEILRLLNEGQSLSKILGI